MRLTCKRRGGFLAFHLFQGGFDGVIGINIIYHFASDELAFLTRVNVWPWNFSVDD